VYYAGSHYSFFKIRRKSLITGFVLVECTTEPTLSLDDFVFGGPGDRISSRSIACPLSNIGLTQALKNFQYVMQIVFSDSNHFTHELFRLEN
jgi:hypothetical protein